MPLRGAATVFVAGVSAAFTYAATTDPFKGPVGRYIRSLDPEDAHNLAIKLARLDLAAPPRLFFMPSAQDPPSLSTKVWGMNFKHPVGLAAGFDKHGEAVPGLFHIGFSFIEVGSVTPEPQPGNPRPRVFRLEEDAGVINRYGFNSHGMKAVYDRLYKFDFGGRNQHRYGPIGVNLGKNKTTPEEHAVDDYLKGLRTFGELAEYIVINVSSPNTPGLRRLQARDALRSLLGPIMKERDTLVYRPPILVKIAPDLSRAELEDVCAVARELRVDGLIVSNTTLDRGALLSANRDEKGGVSGRPLREKSTQMIRDVYALTDGAIPIVGVGGIESGIDAYNKIRAGASLVQLYTALTYHGPWLVRRIVDDLDVFVRNDGFKSIAEAVGADHRTSKESAK